MKQTSLKPSQKPGTVDFSRKTLDGVQDFAHLPPGLMFIPNFITSEEEIFLMQKVDEGEWNDALKRRTQHYGRKRADSLAGFAYDYTQRAVSRSNPNAPPLPEWWEILRERLRQFDERPPEQLIVNEYFPGQGISKHKDAGSFGEPVVSISLGSTCIMTFRNGAEVRHVFLPRCSAVALVQSLILASPAHRP